MSNLTHRQNSASLDWSARTLPGGHATFEIAWQVVVANADELADRVLVDLGGIRNQDDRCAKRHDPTDPRCKRRAKLHVVNAADVSPRVVVD